MRKIRIIAIFAAIITAVLVYFFLSNINKPNEVQTASVVTAKYNIAENIIISQDMLEVVELPSEAVHSSAAQSISEVVGKVSNGMIVENEQIIVTKLVEPGESFDSLAYAIEEGQRAFTVAVDEVSGVAGLLQPQNSVDILLTITVEKIAETDPDEEVEDPIIGEDTLLEETTIVEENIIIRETYSAELFQNIKILAVGLQLNQNVPEEETGYKTVTLSVTPEQAVRLNLAIATGQVRLILRSPLNDEVIEMDIITIDDLITELQENSPGWQENQS
ncbi:MAG: Flp pilus assembly protein CpaB [Clostridia bacterium]|jgi:pilus assembly protein CpaB|nr:Flp pilus assembly protein CpaB [Clostridia bacterium]